MKLEHAPVPALRPSEYTAHLIQVLQANAHRVRGADVLEIGSGSGVVMAALGALAAKSLCGVDIEEAAIVVGRRLMDELGYNGRAELRCGDLWQPVGERRFGVIAANLPHFPMQPVEVGGRLPTWSSGGPDGRQLLDRFLEGLPRHLTPDGIAVLTHNAFVGLERSRDIVRRLGLALRVATTTLVYIEDAKIDRMTDSVLLAEEGRSIHRYGPYTFAEMHIVEIGTPDVLA
ncbi:MAG TPA: methyltransferase [Reyranella sp.]|jgi:methylase of polypeptide subunit release factors|nr:methyltransferase [Reyranella sp.]